MWYKFESISSLFDDEIIVIIMQAVYHFNELILD